MKKKETFFLKITTMNNFRSKVTWVSDVTHRPLVKPLLSRKHQYFTLIPDQRPCSQSPTAIKYEMFCLIFYLLIFGCHYMYLQFKPITCMSSCRTFRLGDHMLFYYLRTWSPPSFYVGPVWNTSVVLYTLQQEIDDSFCYRVRVGQSQWLRGENQRQCLYTVFLSQLYCLLTVQTITPTFPVNGASRSFHHIHIYFVRIREKQSYYVLTNQIAFLKLTHTEMRFLCYFINTDQYRYIFVSLFSSYAIYDHVLFFKCQSYTRISTQEFIYFVCCWNIKSITTFSGVTIIIPLAKRLSSIYW